MRMKRGDTKPDLIIDLTDNGLPLDLSAATSVRVIGKRGGDTVLFNDTAPTVNALSGVVTHLWLTTETATVGRIMVEVEVTWVGGAVQSFPSLDYLAVDITPDLG